MTPATTQKLVRTIVLELIHVSVDRIEGVSTASLSVTDVVVRVDDV